MNLGEHKCVLLLILFLEDALCQTDCISPAPGKCSRDNTSISSDKVCGLDAGTCDFSNSAQLCSYRQGCADPGMSTWKIADGAAQVEQSGPADCSSEYYYSVLESPWLNLTHISCLKFTYNRTTPAALDVYLKQRGKSFTIVHGREKNSDHSQRHNVQETVHPGTKKVIFRAYGGGGGDGQVTVYNVSVKTGVCRWSGGISVTPVSTDVKQWTSPLLSSTEPGTVDCLTFHYTLSSENGTMLTVSVQPLGDNRTVAVWRDDSTGDGQRQGECPLQVDVPYRIIFEEKKSITTRSINVDVRWFQRSLTVSECPLNPSTAKTDASNTVVMSTAPTQPITAAEGCTVQATVPWMTTKSSPGATSTVPKQPLTAAEGNTVQGTVPWMTTESSPRSQGSTTQRDQKDANVAVIGGGVAAAVIVFLIIAIIIIVIVMWRRRRLNKHDDKGKTTEVDRQKGNGVATLTEQCNSDDCPQIREPESRIPPSIPLEAGSRSDMDAAASHPRHADVDPYQLIQDEPPGNILPSSGEDDYNHTGMTDRAAPHGIAVDDDYHHLRSPQTMAEAEDGPVHPPGTHATGSSSASQTALDYTYAQVNKQRGVNTTEVGPGTSNLYTKVNKEAKKPALAPKPTLPKGHDDPYNRLNGSSDSRQSGQTGSEKKPVDDEYNRLNFGDPHRGVAAVEASGAMIGLYSRVRGDPDDEYSKADGGKRQVVIDSGYDHVQFADSYAEGGVV